MFRWTTTVAHYRPKWLNKLAVESSVYMAFFNFVLSLFKRTRDVQRTWTPFLSVQRTVYRLIG